jgi:outer membrane lipoprotein-sorting protein
MMMTRGRWILVALVACSLIGGALAYKRWPSLLRKLRKPPAVVSTTSDQPLSIPPFSTSEPERYQATRVISEIEKRADGSLAPAGTESFLIARDGQNRRQEYREREVVVVFLENATGQFVLLPNAKIYCLAPPLDEGIENSPNNELTNSSANRLLHQTPTAALYQKLGSEAIEGRATTKYRVTEGTGGTEPEESVTLIWVDDELGLPVKTEMTSGSMIVTIELKDIRREVDPQLFELPKDYKKVDFAALSKEKSIQAGSGPQLETKSKNP